MADAIEPGTTVTIRYEPTGEERDVDLTAVPFFPGWVVLRKDGSVNPNPKLAPSEKKD